MEVSKYLFIYGTLMPEHAPGVISGAVKKLCYVGTASAQGRLYDLGEYPGAVLDPSSRTEIRGRLFILPEDESLLKSLDEYEGFNPNDPEKSLFAREETTVTLESGQEVPCWIYIYNQDVSEAKLISGGDYLKYRAA